MSARATWFGPAERPLAGWLHVPDDGTARAAVVLCPAVGLEAVPSHRTLRTLAERLASLGFVTLRLDYDGTGDSAGSHADPDRLPAWLSSIRAAVAEVRELDAALPVVLLGLRLGAALVAESLVGDLKAVTAAVLWDPPESGRRFLRQQEALGRVVGCRKQPDGGIDAPGVLYAPATVEAIRGLVFDTLETLPVERLLVLTREGADPSGLLPRQLAADKASVPGMSRLLDVESVEAVVPSEALDRISGWLDAAMPIARLPITPRWIGEASVGAGVVERHRRIGPLGLVAVETVPEQDGGQQPIVLLNNAAEHHVGPVRMWPELARDWAAAGVRSIRVDVSGVGDSPTRPGEADDIMYSPHAEQDVVEVLTEVGRATLVGMCSGGHLALRVGTQAPTAAVVAINVPTTAALPPTPVGPDAASDWQIERPLPRRVLRALGMPDAGRGLARRVEQLLSWLPERIWVILIRLKVVVSPGAVLTSLRDIDATLICGPEDGVGYLTRGRRELEQARRQGLRFVRADDLDHIPMPVHQREALKVLLTEHVLHR